MKFEKGILSILKMVAPGTFLREGLDNILRAKTGALIVVGDSQKIIDIVDGGFFINSIFTPAYLYELAKMDGAIVLSRDIKRILYANALLIPDPAIPSNETGTRHKSAERVANQTKELVICISQRRNVITLYKSNKKYVLRDTPTILSKANQAIQTLEKYKTVLDGAMNNLSMLEFEDIVTLNDIATVIQRREMVMRIAEEIDRYICELGNEGRLVNMQLEELIFNIEEEGILVIEDYLNYDEVKGIDDVLAHIRSLNYEDLMDIAQICRIIGYPGGSAALNNNVSPRGYRILSTIPRVPMNVVRNLVDRFNNLKGVIKASIEELDSVEGIGEVRAGMIKEGLRRSQDQLLLDYRYR